MMKNQGYRCSRLSRPLVFLLSGIAICGIALFALVPTLAQASGSSFLQQFHTISTLSSTIPANGDVNPYGTFVIPRSQGKLVRGNVLVSNFNNSANQQGTGTTIVQITPGTNAPAGKAPIFAQLSANQLPGACPGGLGLTTALVVLQYGWVIVGSLPSQAGNPATVQAGCLIVLNSQGQAVETFSGGLINGPWDMTVADFGNQAALFVTNVLNGTVAGGGNVVNKGTVIRINLFVPQQDWGMPRIESTALIGSGFSEETNQAALVIGPTGVGLGRNDILYVADTINNRIAAIPNALFRHTTAFAGEDVTSNGFVNGPLGMTIAPNGNILTVNGGDGNIVETTPDGQQLTEVLLDKTGTPPGAGCLFGLALIPHNGGVYFVDDCTNTLNSLS